MDNSTLPPWREIVSKVLENQAGRQAWVEMDAAGNLTVRCTGCGLDEFAFAMAPAIGRLVGHVADCFR